MRTYSVVRVVAAIVLIGSVPLVAQGRRPVETRGVSLSLLCGPQASYTAPVPTITVQGGTEPRKALFAAGETILLNAGTAQGVRAGQQFYVRRVVSDELAIPAGPSRPFSIHSAGWVTVRETLADSSVAVVSESCDGISTGDFLEPLVLPAAETEIATGEPDFSRPAQVIMADERRQLGVSGSLMIIDRGSDHGLRPGQRLTLFRPGVNGVGPVVRIGHAVVASTQQETSLMRIGATTGEVQLGDLVAIYK
ncbi:MAG TPA: hypothetical protein VM493_01335 [Vicinamibacterales bacterium]|nr:hypothetical protein [Vicinamibacterales bacterium]